MGPQGARTLAGVILAGLVAVTVGLSVGTIYLIIKLINLVVRSLS